MNRISTLTLSGFLVVMAGIVTLTAQSIGINTAKWLTPALFVASGVSAYMFAMANKQHRIAHQYHLAQAFGMIIFGTLVGSFAKDLNSFLNLVTYFLMIFGFFEILFAFSAFNTGLRLNKTILATRLIAGLVGLIGGFALLMTYVKNQISGVNTAGVLILIGGLSILLFSVYIKKTNSIVE